MSLKDDVDYVRKTLSKEVTELQRNIALDLRTRMDEFNAKTGLLVTDVGIQFARHKEHTVAGTTIDMVMINDVTVTTNANLI